MSKNNSKSNEAHGSDKEDLDSYQEKVSKDMSLPKNVVVACTMSIDGITKLCNDEDLVLSLKLLIEHLQVRVDGLLTKDLQNVAAISCGNSASPNIKSKNVENLSTKNTISSTSHKYQSEKEDEKDVLRETPKYKHKTEKYRKLINQSDLSEVLVTECPGIGKVYGKIIEEHEIEWLGELLNETKEILEKEDYDRFKEYWMEVLGIKSETWIYTAYEFLVDWYKQHKK